MVHYSIFFHELCPLSVENWILIEKVNDQCLHVSIKNCSPGASWTAQLCCLKSLFSWTHPVGIPKTSQESFWVRYWLKEAWSCGRETLACSKIPPVLKEMVLHQRHQPPASMSFLTVPCDSCAMAPNLFYGIVLVAVLLLP